MSVAGQETSEKVPAGSVLDVDPAPGQQVREGGTVAVRLSSGSKLVAIPDLRGKSPDEAKNLLTSMNLDLDRTDPIADNKIPQGMIVRQSPDPKTKVDRFSRVNVWVSTGPSSSDAVTSTTTPATQSPNTRYIYTITIKLTKITDPVLLRVNIVDSGGNRKIYEQQRQPNDTVNISTEGFGSHAVFMIYYNDTLVSQKDADGQLGDNQDNPTNTDNGDNGDNSTTGDNGDNGVGQ
jgi:serine/threonine-protein kinase